MAKNEVRHHRHAERRRPPRGVYTPKPGVGPADVPKHVFQERPSAGTSSDADEA